MDLQDRPVREMDVQQPLQSPLDMGEHIGGRQQLPGMAPGIVDAEERFGLLVPGNQRKIVGETIPANGAAQPRIAQPTHGCGSGAGGTIAGAAGTLAGTARSEEHTSELQSLMRISYAVFCLKKNTITQPH